MTVSAPVPVTLTDSGQASDQLRPAAAVTVAESGTAAETASPAAAVPLADQGQAADTLRSAAQVLLADSGAATDSLSVTTPPQAKTLEDVGVATDRLAEGFVGPEGAPNQLWEAVNLAGQLTDIVDDPASPDTAWLTAVDPFDRTRLRVGFPYPPTSPAAGGPTQFEVWLRKDDLAGAADPVVNLELWEGGQFRATAGEGVQVTSTSGQLVTGTFDPAVLTDPSGGGVELAVVPCPAGAYHAGYNDC